MFILHFIAALACLYLLSVGLGALNRMSKNTLLQIRLAYVALTVGAAAQLVWSFDLGYTPSRIAGSIFTISVAVYFSVNRRNPA